MGDKIKILHINSYYSNRSFYKFLFDAQVAAGKEIKVIVPILNSYHIPNVDMGKYTKILKSYNIFERFTFKRRQEKTYKIIKKNMTINSEENIIVHAHSLFRNGHIALRLKQEYGFDYIVAVRNTDVNIFFKYMLPLRKIGVKILNNAAYIVFLSPYYNNYVIENYVPERFADALKSKSVIIPNGVDYYYLNNLNINKHRNKLDILKIITVGEISRNKNQLKVLEAVEILAAKGKHVEYTVIGKSKSSMILKKLQSSKLVKYIPHINKEQLIFEYRNADIFVMPSLKETFGLTYVEAMTQGLPVIYSRGQGFDGQFPEGEVGYAVHSLDSYDIANKILKIEKELEIISYRCIINAKKFTWDSIEKEYDSIYRDILKKII